MVDISIKIALIHATNEKLNSVKSFVELIERSKEKKDKVREYDNYPARLWLVIYGYTGKYGNSYETVERDKETLADLLDAMLPMLKEKVARFEAELNALVL